jgi:hypothetical protein
LIFSVGAAQATVDLCTEEPDAQRSERIASAAPVRNEGAPQPAKFEVH